jgi:hypothetical protein
VIGPMTGDLKIDRSHRECFGRPFTLATIVGGLSVGLWILRFYHLSYRLCQIFNIWENRYGNIDNMDVIFNFRKQSTERRDYAWLKNLFSGLARPK